MKYLFDVFELDQVKVACPEDAGLAVVAVPVGAVVGLAYAELPK